MTYVVAVPNRRTRKRTVHANLMKKWRTQADDHKLTVEQSTQLDDVLQKWAVVLSADPGRVSIVNHALNTGSASPVRVAPYRVAPAWREQLERR